MALVTGSPPCRLACRFRTFAADALPARELVIDAEAVVLDDNGLPDMVMLRSNLAAGVANGSPAWPLTSSISTASICGRHPCSPASSFSRNCWSGPATPCATADTWRGTAKRSGLRPALWAWRGSSASRSKRRTAPAGRRPRSRPSANSGQPSRSSPSSGLSRARSPRSTSAGGTARDCSMPARSGQAIRR